MRFRYGFCGAVLGFFFGGVTVVLAVSLILAGDDFSQGFAIMTFGPIGLAFGAILGAVAALRVWDYVHGNHALKTSPKQKAWLVRGFAVGGPILVFGMLWLAFNLGGPPSDEQMMTNFQQHRPTFNQLIQMVQADKEGIHIDTAAMLPMNTQAPSIPLDRINTYRRLMKTVGLARWLTADAKATDVEMAYYANGSAISSDVDKGYVYLTQPPTPLMRTLDQYGTDGDGSGRDTEVLAYRHIQGDWYLYYRYEPG